MESAVQKGKNETISKTPSLSLSASRSGESLKTDEFEQVTREVKLPHLILTKESLNVDGT